MCNFFFFLEKYMIWVLMVVSLCNVVIGNLHLCSIVCYKIVGKKYELGCNGA